jgi:hypothetical protein
MHTRKYFWTSLAVVILLAGAPASAMTVAQNGRAEAIIVVGADAPEPERHAAQELAHFLGRITGSEFKVTDGTLRADSRILVGRHAARRIYPTFSTDGLGTDGIAIRTTGNDLILVGGQPRGTLYAVYTFLEDHLGCRWWSSTESTIPHKPTVTVGNIDVRYVPVLEYREPFWFDAHDGDWAVRNKCNGNAVRVDARRGGKHTYEGFVHTFFPLIPPEKYFKDHPEWFSEIDGNRMHQRAQLCLTNEAMRRELVRNLKARLRANPSATIASVSQNDWRGNCRCAQCSAIEEEFPNVAISTLAYQHTRKPPKHVRPRDNVIVRLCSIECSFSTPLANERNKEFRDDIVGWSKICDRLYIWDYTTNFRHHIMPHPNLRVLGPNVKFFADHNVKGIFEQGAYTTNGAEMAELRAWMLAKLLWDPTRDGAALVNEFVENYYGPAAPHVKAYLNVTHEAVEESGDWLGCFEKHTAKYLSFETLSAGWAHLKAAEEAVRDDRVMGFRVQVAQLPVRYVFMMRWNEMRQAAEKAGAEWPLSDSIETVHQRFMEIARKKNITRLNEWNPGFGKLDEAVASVKE